MALYQIVTTANELNAAIIKSFLENEGVTASLSRGVAWNGQNAFCTVYCEEDQKERALKLLKEKGLLE